jgi:hypothetical protein
MNYLIWILEGNKVWFMNKIRAKDEKIFSFIELIVNLEFNKVIIPEKRTYVAWYELRNEALETINVMEDMLTDYQKVIDNSLGQDLNLFVCLGILLYLGKLDREFSLINDGKEVFSMFDGRATGLMDYDVYQEISNMECENIKKQIALANYLLCNRSVHKIDDDLIDRVIEYYTIFRIMVLKFNELTENAVEFDDYESPMPKVRKTRTYNVTEWLCLLYKEMVKLDAGKILNNITEKFVVV